MILDCWTKDMLFLEERLCICVDRKEEKALDPFQSDMDQTQQGRPPEDLEKFEKIKQHR